MLLHGIFPPVTTPFYPDGNVYYKKLESNVERYSRTPCAGIVVLGSTGEAILLSDQERREVLKHPCFLSHGRRPFAAAGNYLQLPAGHRLRHSRRTCD
jgi:dihydrodipicolinate synthase/N-acetylneuraminate lyase